jgi:hypothetical protein
MTATPAEKNVLTVLESCFNFKIVPGMEAELDVSSETFVAAVEDEVRDRLRPDRRQRDWVLARQPPGTAQPNDCHDHSIS